MDGTFGSVLKTLREAAGLTSLRTAGTALNVSHTHLWSMETKGFIPHPDMVRKLDAALGAEGQLIAAAERDTLTPDERLRLRYVGDDPKRLDAKAVESMSAVLQAQRRLDDAIGSTPLLGPIAAYMTGIESMVVNARGPVRGRALQVAGQWAQFAGWINTATENWDRAELWFGKALAWASECGDQEMVATVLSYSGHVAWLTGHPAATVSLSQAARRDRSVYTGQQAYDAIQQARGLAVMGEVRDAENLLAYAVDLTGPAVAQLQGSPPWHYYRSQGMWDVELGRAYLYIPGRAGDAARLLEQGLATIPEADVEWMRSYHDDLATARKLSA